MIARKSSAAECATNVAAQLAWIFCLVVLLFATGSARAAELAILSNGFSIRHEHHMVLGSTTRLFLSADDSSFTDVPTADITGFEKDMSVRVPDVADSPAPVRMTSEPAGSGAMKSAPAKSRSARSGPVLPLNDVVNSASAAYHLDPDLVNSVIHAESGFNAHAVSPKGARGLMQLMPETANKLGVNDSFDSQANVDGGSRYLRELLERYNFDLVKALAAYNAGPQRVDQYRGVPPFRETRAYVARIVHEYNRKKIAQEKEEARQRVAEKRAAKPQNRATKPATTTTTIAETTH